MVEEDSNKLLTALTLIFNSLEAGHGAVLKRYILQWRALYPSPEMTHPPTALPPPPSPHGHLPPPLFPAKSSPGLHSSVLLLLPFFLLVAIAIPFHALSPLAIFHFLTKRSACSINWLMLFPTLKHSPAFVM